MPVIGTAIVLYSIAAGTNRGILMAEVDSIFIIIRLIILHKIVV